jgi:hypothetical protein
MPVAPKLSDPHRKKTRAGHVVHVYHPSVGGLLYVPIIPAWGAAGLRRALEGVAREVGEPRTDPAR